MEPSLDSEFPHQVEGLCNKHESSSSLVHNTIKQLTPSMLLDLGGLEDRGHNCRGAAS